MQKYDIKKIIAFTLAEVIIVLGIVGIVAEMTIPTLVNNVNENIYYAGAKKAYSSLSQALLLIAADPNLTMDTTDQFTTLDSFLNVMRDMGKGDDITLLGSVNYYHYKCKIPFGPINYGQATSYSTDSGILIINPEANCNSAQDAPICSDIYWDTNGLKPPNMNGYDLLAFRLYKQQGVYQIRPLGMPGSGDGYSCSPACSDPNVETTSDGCTFQRVMGLPMP